MYLFGSLAYGNFDQDSDVDVMVVTGQAVTAEQFAALSALHTRLAALPNRWADRLEVSYIPRDALRRYDPAQATHPHLDRSPDEQLIWMEHDGSWNIQRETLRNQGVVLWGPHPRTLIDPVSAEVLRRSMLDLLHSWSVSLLEDPAQITRRGFQSYIVLSHCRMLYTLVTGAITTKRGAAAWAAEHLEPRWRGLITRAWDGRHAPALPVQADEVKETLDLVRCVLARSQEFEG